MVDLYTALKLVDMFDRDNDVVFLRNASTPVYRYGSNPADEVLLVKDVKNKYDLRKIKVKKIEPHFIGSDYEGFLFVISQ